MQNQCCMLKLAIYDLSSWWSSIVTIRLGAIPLSDLIPITIKLEGVRETSADLQTALNACSSNQNGVAY
jgi:hypothetical protein